MSKVIRMLAISTIIGGSVFAAVITFAAMATTPAMAQYSEVDNASGPVFAQSSYRLNPNSPAVASLRIFYSKVG
jgi:hypothetical protein